MLADTPLNQPQRLEALRRYGVLDSPREADFDDVVRLVARICEVPVALISLVDEDRQWFKAEIGFGQSQTPLDQSICSHAILQPDLFEIPDTLEDPRTADNPLVTGEPFVRFYTGAPLVTQDGLALGTLCVLDYKPRRLDETQRMALRVLANQVQSQMDLRRLYTDASLLAREIDHRVKNSLAMVSGVLNLQASAADDGAVAEALGMARDRVGAIVRLHEHLHGSADPRAVEMGVFLPSLVGGLAQAVPPHVRLAAESDTVELDVTRATIVGMLANELVTNSIKHGTDGRAGLAVDVSLRRAEGKVELRVSDDGAGSDALDGGGTGDGLGMRLLRTMTKRLRGTLAYSREDGRTVASISFPLARA